MEHSLSDRSAPLQRFDKSWLLAAALLLAAVGGGCTGERGDLGGGDDADGVGHDVQIDPNGVTWHRDVRALVERNCVGCHTAGGAAPFSLESYEAAKAVAPAMVGAVMARRMPPWPMDPSCREIDHARALSEAQIRTFEQWAANDFAEGSEADYVAPQPPPDVLGELGAPSLRLAASEPYTAPRALSDDYRCLVLDHVFDRETFVTAIDVEPDQRAIVHHVLVYEVLAADAARIDALDAASPGLGYTCFGGPGTNTPKLIGGWVPGMQPTVYPPDSGVPIEAGSRLVMQVHYNVAAVRAGDAVPADQTHVALWTAPEQARPNHRVTLLAISQNNLLIRAGDAHSQHSATLDVPLPATVVGVIPHMHMLGTRLEVQVERPGAEALCVADVPRWDFNWQQYYAYQSDDYVQALPGDRLRLTCTYDNSAANQPFIDGQQEPPRDVTFGEGTRDEMCLAYLAVLTPDYRTGSGAQCDGAAACLRDCERDDGACAFTCLATAEGDCLGCNLQPIYTSCAVENCPLPAQQYGSCLQRCSGETLECTFTDCKREFETYWSCLGPRLATGACNSHTASCGLTMP